MSILATYMPMFGRNFQAWNEPPVAIYKWLAAGCGEMIQSCVGVTASLRLLTVEKNALEIN